MGLQLGKQTLGQLTQTQSATAAASTLGAIDGSLSLQAGQAVLIRGSDLSVPKGQIDIAGRSVSIVEARESSSLLSQQRMTQTGYSMSLSSSVVSNLQSANAQIKGANKTGSDRMKALAAANAAMAAKDSWDAVKAGNQPVPVEGGGQGAGGPQTQDPQLAGRVGGVQLSVSLGTSRSFNELTQKAETARGSTVTAGQGLSVRASGDGAASTVLVQGARGDRSPLNGGGPWGLNQGLPILNAIRFGWKNETPCPFGLISKACS